MGKSGISLKDTFGGNFGVFEKCDFVPVCVVCVFVYSKKDKILVFFSFFETAEMLNA